jgi:hypothetical protein
MEEFSDYSASMIFKAMGKSPDSNLVGFEAEELSRHYETILMDLSNLAPKELEAYMTINSCHSYEQFAQFIINREKKNVSSKEYEKLLASLRTRAHRGRKKVIKAISQLYDSDR